MPEVVRPRLAAARAVIATTLLSIACGGEPRISLLEAPVATTGAQSADPSWVLDPDNGDVLLTWVGGDTMGWALHFARSSDGGATWSTPVRVNDRPRDVTPHGEASPRLVAARGGVVAVAWPHSYPVEGRKWGATHMRLARSTDGGRTWNPTVTLNDDTARGPGSHTFHDAAWDGGRGFVVAWLDERTATGSSPAPHGGGGHTAASDEPEEADAAMFIARSRDLGASWEAVNEAKWGAVCPCCRVALARAPDGRLAVAWRKHFAGSVRDVAAGPLDGDESAQVRVHADNWVFPGCPHTGPAIAVDGRGRTHVAWYTGKPEATGIRYARGSVAGDIGRFERATFIQRGAIPTAHVSVAGLPEGGCVIAFDRDPTGDARLRVATVDAGGTASASAVVPDSEGADHPAIVALDDSTALVAWTRQDDAGSRVQLARVYLSPR